MTTDHNDPDGLNWQIARAIQPEIYKMLNQVSKLDHNHTRDMNVDRNRCTGTWWWAVKMADVAISVLPDEHDGGYRVINTAAELEALPPMSVFTDVDGEAWQVYEDQHGRRIRCNAGSGIPWQEAYFPATVLPQPSPHDDEPEHGNPFGDVEDYLGPLTIRPLRHVE